MFTLASKITLIRILAVPFLVVILYFPTKLGCLAAVIVFICASLTDFVDGFVARRHNQVTNFGKFLDPLADKVLIGSVLIMLVQLGWVPAWIAIIILARELTVTGLRAAAADKGMVIGADKFGKVKTVLQVLALLLLMLHYPWFGYDPVPLGKIMLYIALAMTVFSGGNYLYSFYRNWLHEDDSE
jgi:CDP-diacylglycerol---glycerol-3-phosphate 3-phosphatidyltransferase